jgi:hypothetical protein
VERGRGCMLPAEAGAGGWGKLVPLVKEREGQRFSSLSDRSSRFESAGRGEV